MKHRKNYDQATKQQRERDFSEMMFKKFGFRRRSGNRFLKIDLLKVLKVLKVQIFSKKSLQSFRNFELFVLFHLRKHLCSSYVKQLSYNKTNNGS